MRTEIIPADQPDAITRALGVLRRGGLVVFPTDTVYGLGASAFMPESIERLFVVKGRDNAKAIAILLGETTQLDLVANDIGDSARRLAAHFWPGPLTLVVPSRPGLPEVLSPLPTIGIRIPDHPLALTLLRRAGPLATTSANLSGQPSPVTAEEAAEQLRGRVRLILDGGRTPGGIPSTVVDCTTPEPVILRPGPLDAGRSTRY